MNAEILFESPVAIARIALPLRPYIIRAVVPEDVGGAYCIYRARKAVYAGRSKRIRSRLLNHAAADLGTHFNWQPADDRAAFVLESIWFHRLVDADQAENLIHPAKPMAHPDVSCPMCNEAYTTSMAITIRKLLKGVK